MATNLLECQSCGGAGAVPCEGCGALGWCLAPLCRKLARVQHGPRECSRMRQQLRRPLFGAGSGMPFTFGPGTGWAGRCRALEDLGVHGRGVYAAECACYQGASGEQHLPFSEDLPAPKWLGVQNRPGAARGGECGDWAEFYRLRGLPLEHPAAVALHWALTIHRCLASVVSWGKRPRRVHVIGAAHSECRTLHTLAELGGLGWAGEHGLDVVLAGPGVPPEIAGVEHCMTVAAGNGDEGALPAAWGCSCLGSAFGIHRGPPGPAGVRRGPPADWGPPLGASGALVGAAGGQVSVVCLRGRYCRDLLSERGLEGPEVVVAMNAGLPAFPEWEPSVLFVLASGAPLFVTDLTEEAAVQARALVAGAAMRKLPTGPPGARPGRWDISEVDVNPFRQPLSSRGADNLLPTCSNGFLFSARWAEAHEKAKHGNP